MRADMASLMLESVEGLLTDWALVWSWHVSSGDLDARPLNVAVYAAGD